jgi:GxxExxY protein
MDFLYKTESYKIIGAAMEVHSELGCGFLEAVYQEALEKEFIYRKIPYEREKRLGIHYKEDFLSSYYVADFICYDKIIVELKALDELNSEHESQVLNYLKATGFKLGLLINFGEKSLVYKRSVRLWE